MKTTFSAMWSEKLGKAIDAVSTEPYPIECRVESEDFQSLETAIGQKIDAHLEAVFFAESCENGRLRLEIEPASVSVLVRRLLEDGDDNAESLASGICQTLGIELI